MEPERVTFAPRRVRRSLLANQPTISGVTIVRVFRTRVEYAITGEERIIVCPRAAGQTPRQAVMAAIERAGA